MVLEGHRGGGLRADALSSLCHHQGLSGKSGPRGERGPTVSAAEEVCGSRAQGGALGVFLTTPLSSL